jgi:voltage-gated potassium channel
MSNRSPEITEGLIHLGPEKKMHLFKSNLVLLGSLVIIIFVFPVIPFKEHYLTRILFCTVVISGLYAADFSRKAFRILLTYGTLVVIATMLNMFFMRTGNFGILVFFLNTLFFIMVTIALVAHVATAREVYASTVLCAINSYLLIGLTLSILFLIMDLYFPGSFSEVDANNGGFAQFIYYGIVTMTTLGYGDITPDTALARSLSNFTALFGQLYLVIIMALIIGKFLNNKKSRE